MYIITHTLQSSTSALHGSTTKAVAAVPRPFAAAAWYNQRTNDVMRAAPAHQKRAARVPCPLPLRAAPGAAAAERRRPLHAVTREAIAKPGIRTCDTSPNPKTRLAITTKQIDWDRVQISS
jgi:hypothetical protein